VTRSGKPLDRHSVWQGMKRLSKSAGVLAGKVFPHNLRRLFARTFYAKIPSLAELADVMGHSNVNTTRIYTANTADHLRRKLASLPLLLQLARSAAFPQKSGASCVPAGRPAVARLNRRTPVGARRAVPLQTKHHVPGTGGCRSRYVVCILRLKFLRSRPYQPRQSGRVELHTRLRYLRLLEPGA
jgi:hypothetical protein